MKGPPEDPTKYQQYDINLLSTDLRHEELVHQIAGSLDYLQNVMNDVFSKAEERVKANRHRLAQVQHRAKLAQAKVDHLKGRKKATQVFSSAKYPATDKPDEFRSLFSEAKVAPAKHSNYKLVKKQHNAPTDEDLKNKLKFYSVQVGKRSTDDSSSEGLGSLPNNIESVSSLLLFNTAENPYKKYVMLDPRGVVTKIRSSDDEDLTGPADAPITIAMGESAGQKEKETFIYRPDLGDVPLISVPDTLPDLLDVADDLVYGADLGPSIAPSVFQDGNIDMPELPEVVQDTPAVDMSGSGASGPPPPPPSGGAPPPPPPPSAAPPPPPPPPPAAAAPPPPPPTITAAPDAASPPAAPAEPAPAASSGGDDGGRGSLLAAIRGAGGAGKARLKKAASRKMEKKKQKEEPKASSGGGDLMSDLASMLTMRRRGIAGSGAKAKDSTPEAESVPKPQPAAEAPGGVMSKISELIPFSPTTDNTGDDDDWGDDD